MKIKIKHQYMYLLLASLITDCSLAIAEEDKNVDGPKAAIEQGNGNDQSETGNEKASVSEEFTPENWQLKAQSTYIWQSKPKFNAPYTGDYSLRTGKERGNTATATIYAGFKGWTGSEFFLNLEASESSPISNLRGMGGLSNSENQKGGAIEPKTYRARYFIRQTIGLGGETENIESGFNQMASTVDKNRIVLTAGKMSIIDIFDNNKFSHDGRSQFINWSFLTHGSYDYAADTKGYTIGFASELYYQDWAFRFGRFMQPKVSNGPDLDYNMFKQYADQIEIQHDHDLFNQPGSVKLLVFHNKAYMGSFKDAITYGKLNSAPPDVSAVRQLSDKYGIGIALEQNVRDDIGIFARANINDGKRETYAFTEIDKQVSGGMTIFGNKWGRPDDAFGFAIAVNGISKDHQDYISQGGHGAFMGDLAIDTDTPTPGVLSNIYNYSSEKVFEAYYNSQLTTGKAGTLWGALDFQHIINPGYNADRGPVDYLGYRFHYEFDAQNALGIKSARTNDTNGPTESYRSDSGPYMALKVYNSHSSMDTQDFGGVDSFSNNKVGGAFTLGEKFSKNLAVEASYDHLGRFIAHEVTQPNVIDLTALSVNGVGIIPVSDSLDIYGKAGANYGFTDSTNVRDHKLGATYGLGSSYWIQNDLEIKAEWTRFNNLGTNDSNDIKGHVDTIGLGLSYHL